MITPELLSAWRQNDQGVSELIRIYRERINDLGAKVIEWVEGRRDATGRVIGQISIETIQIVLRRAGLANYARGLERLLDSAIEQVAPMLEAAGIPLDISPTAFRNTVFHELQISLAAETAQVSNSLANAIREATLIPKPITTIAKEISAQTGKLYHRSLALVETSLARVQRLTQVEAAKAIPEQERLYLYVGPDDERTRPFCKKRVGKAYSEAQIAKMPAQGGIAVLEGGGGPRCRHFWSPISKAWAERNNVERGR